MQEHRPGDARLEAQLLHELGRSVSAGDLGGASVGDAHVRALHARVSSVADLAARGAWEATAQVANQVLRVVGEVYASCGDPIGARLIKLEYLEREIDLRCQAGQFRAVDAAVEELRATWDALRQRTGASGGDTVAIEYDLHIGVLERSHTPAAVSTQVPTGLRLVAAMNALLA